MNAHFEQRAVLALERQADALDRIADWPRDVLPVLNQTLAAVAPLMAQFADAVRHSLLEIRPALEVLAEAARRAPVDTPGSRG